MGILAGILGNDERALELYAEALQIEKTVRSKIIISLILIYMGMIYIHRGEYEKAKTTLEEGMEICRKMGAQAYLAYLLQSLGMIACYQENFLKARSLYAESLQLLLPLGDQVNIAECIISIGRFAGAQGSFDKFAHLLGAAERSVPDVKQRTFPLFRTETEKFITSARSELGDEAYNAAYELGKQMSLDEAVAYAFKELGQ
jgi:tetratricopeptide (TPR) repeat protein